MAPKYPLHSKVDFQLMALCTSRSASSSSNSFGWFCAHRVGGAGWYQELLLYCFKRKAVTAKRTHCLLPSLSSQAQTCSDIPMCCTRMRLLVEGSQCWGVKLTVTNIVSLDIHLATMTAAKIWNSDKGCSEVRQHITVRQIRWKGTREERVLIHARLKPLSFSTSRGDSRGFKLVELERQTGC